MPTDNPFRDYLPLYGAGVVPERPWWRQRPASPHPSGPYVPSAGDGSQAANSHWARDFVRGDGVWTALAVRNRPSAGGGGAGGSVSVVAMDPCDPVNIGPLAVIDAEHPLPAPRPMCGQVWVHGQPQVEEAIVRVNRRATEAGVWWASEEEPEWFTLTDDNRSQILSFWPPPNAVLVHGPFAPWAPPNWRQEKS